MFSNVTIVSPFRDEAAALAAYVSRVNALDWPKKQLAIVAVEGDSVDGTWASLLRWLSEANSRYHDMKMVKCDMGAPKFGSVINAQRFRTLATVFNKGLDAVDLGWSDYVLMLPADVRYPPDLLRRLTAWDRDVISPFVFKGDIFYDTWAFTKDGNGLGNFPRGELVKRYGLEPVAFDTVGGVMLSHVSVLREGIRYTMEEVDRGYCRHARDLGFSVWADPTTVVDHG